MWLCSSPQHLLIKEVVISSTEDRCKVSVLEITNFKYKISILIIHYVISLRIESFTRDGWIGQNSVCTTGKMMECNIGRIMKWIKVSVAVRESTWNWSIVKTQQSGYYSTLTHALLPNMLWVLSTHNQWGTGVIIWLLQLLYPIYQWL